MRLVFSLLLIHMIISVPMGQSKPMLVDTSRPECQVAYQGLQTAVGDFLRFPIRRLYAWVDSLGNAGRTLKETYYSCVNRTQIPHDAVAEFASGYPDLGSLSLLALRHARQHRREAVKSAAQFVRAVLSLHPQKILKALSRLPGLPKARQIEKSKVDFNSIATNVSRAGVNFLMYSQLAPVNTSGSCISRIDELLGGIAVPALMLWNLHDIPTAVEKLLDVSDLIKNFMKECSEPFETAIDTVPRMVADTSRVFENLRLQPELIGDNVENLERAAQAKDWAGTGAWAGMLVYNVMFTRQPHFGVKEVPNSE